MAELKLVEGWTGAIDDILKSNGVAVNLTGLTVELILQKADGSPVTTAGNVIVVTPASGLVRYSPDAGDLLALETPHVARWRVTDGAGKVSFFPNDAGEVWTVQPAAAVTLQDNALLTVAELKAGLKILNTDQDVAIASFINACSDALENQTGRRLKSRTYTDEYAYLKSGDILDGTEWLVRQWPITALSALSIDGTAQTIWLPGTVGVPTDFDVFVLEASDPKQGRDRICRPGGWWGGALVKRTYTAGYGIAGPPAFPIPGDLKEAVIALAVDWYYARSRQSDPVISRATSGETVTYVNEAMPRRFRELIASYRRR